MNFPFLTRSLLLKAHHMILNDNLFWNSDNFIDTQAQTQTHTYTNSHKRASSDLHIDKNMLSFHFSKHLLDIMLWRMESLMHYEVAEVVAHKASWLWDFITHICLRGAWTCHIVPQETWLENYFSGQKKLRKFATLKYFPCSVFLQEKRIGSSHSLFLPLIVMPWTTQFVF